MMKRMLCVVLTLAMLSVCTACLDTTPNDPTLPTTTTVPRNTTTVPTTTTTESEEPLYAINTTVPTDPPPVETVYQAETLPFSVTLPASWEGNYAVREENSSVKFYELNNHLYDGSGHLFTIRFMSAAAYDDDMFPSYEYLGEFGEQCVVALFPTDVQSSVDYMDAYNAMAANVSDILDTFTYTG